MTNLRVPVNFQSPYDATSLITHIGKSTTTLCACFYAQSEIDGSVVAMTSYSENLSSVPGYGSTVFKRNSGVSASQLQADSGAAFSQMEASLFLLAAAISEADLLAGKWSRAPAAVFVCNYESLGMGQLLMQSGYLSEMVQKGVFASCEIKGLNNALTAQIGTVTRPECSHDFCDAGCGLDPADYTVAITLTSVSSQTVFAASALTLPDDYFNNGKLVFTSGPNTNYILRVDDYNSTTKTFTLRTPAPYLPSVGETANALKGCQKRLIDCKNALENDGVTNVNNVLNRAAFDFMPSMESFTRLPAGM